jgi:hypothetical protein
VRSAISSWRHGRILGTLQQFDHRLTDDERTEIVALIEACVTAYDHYGTGKRFFLKLLAAPEGGRGQPGVAVSTKRRIAASLEAEARGDG